MADPVNISFKITSKLDDCINPPADPAQDLCKVQIEDQDKLSFVLERRGGKFQVSSVDASKVAKAYPSYKPPIQELKDYILLKKEVFSAFGDAANPASITGKIQILSVEDVFKTIETTLNFVSHGRLNPANAGMKTVMEEAIKNFIATFADPVLGILLDKMLRSVQNNPNLGAESKKRIEFLLMTNQAREKFWEAMKPEIEKSLTLGDALKGTSRDIIIFLFANHILADKGYEKTLFSDTIKSAADTHREVMSKVDTDYNASANFYAYLVKVLSQLKKTAKVPEEYRVEFERRIDVAVSEYQKAAQKETLRLLPNESSVEGFRIYLRVKYGDTPARREAVDLLLKQTKIQNKEGKPTFEIAFAGLSSSWKDWAKGKSSSQEKSEATEAILYLLKELFERGGKMEIYWDKKVQTMPNFYQSSNLPLLGTNKTYLEGLIKWARGKADDQGVELPPGGIPHVGFRKWTFLTELGVGAAGFATYAGLSTMENGDAKYYGRYPAVIAGGAGVGAALGNTLSYAFDADKYDWLFDAGGSLVGGALAGVLYGLLTPAGGGPVPPGPNPGKPCIPGDKGNCTKFPVDPYAQSYPGSHGLSFSVGGKF